MADVILPTTIYVLGGEKIKNSPPSTQKAFQQAISEKKFQLLGN